MAAPKNLERRLDADTGGLIKEALIAERWRSRGGPEGRGCSVAGTAGAGALLDKVMSLYTLHRRVTWTSNARPRHSVKMAWGESGSSLHTGPRPCRWERLCSQGTALFAARGMPAGAGAGAGAGLVGRGEECDALGRRGGGEDVAERDVLETEVLPCAAHETYIIASITWQSDGGRRRHRWGKTRLMDTIKKCRGGE
jgi:hypothetical protein